MKWPIADYLKNLIEERGGGCGDGEPTRCPDSNTSDDESAGCRESAGADRERPTVKKNLMFSLKYLANIKSPVTVNLDINAKLGYAN